MEKIYRKFEMKKGNNDDKKSLFVLILSYTNISIHE